MGQPAARLTDMHTGPLFSGTVPHVGGPILPICMPNVLIGGLPAARVGDLAYCNPPPDVIVQGSPTVLIGGQMAARLGDMTAHGGVIVVGDPTVLIGDGASGVSDGGSGGAMDALSGAASAVGTFVEGVGEGAWDALTGMVEGIGHLAVDGYKLATDNQYREQTLDAAIADAKAAGRYIAKAAADPDQAVRDLGNAASEAWDKVETGYQHAAAQGKGAEFIGKGVGQAVVLVGGALIPGGAEADAAGLAGDAGRAAELAGDAGKASDAVEDASSLEAAATEGPTDLAEGVRGPSLRPDLDDKWITPEGQPNWPANDGFAEPPIDLTLTPDGPTPTLGRFGGPGGNYFAPAGTPFEDLALPYDQSTMPYTQYQVMKPFPVKSGSAAPWFDQPGGGQQFLSDKSADELVDGGYLKELSPAD